MKILHDGQGVIIGIEKFGKKEMNDLPDLKVIGANITGLDLVDLDEADRRGVKVISLRDYPEFTKTITSTAEHTIGLIIALLRNYKIALNAPSQDRDVYKGHVLRGKCLGLIGGNGRVGRQVKRMAEGLGMKVLVYDIHSTFWQRSDYFSSIIKSDIVSLHIPLSINEGFFTKRMFQMMKPTAYFVNTSRSKIVEDGALLWALENAIIKGAAVDFIDDMELVEYSKTYDNLILTNHQGGNTWEDRELTENFIIKRVENYLNGL